MKGQMRPVRWLAMPCLVMALGCSPPAQPDAKVLALLQRVEAHLESHQSELGPTHAGLLYELEPGALRSFMDRIEFRPSTSGFVLGVSYGPESHGGGLLALLLRHWRPEGNAAALEDRYWFEPNQEHLALRALYEGYKQQIYLPIPEVPPSKIRGRIPERGTLPRIRFRFGPGAPTLERDAYRHLGVLLRHEPDLDGAWSNEFGQSLSVTTLLDHVRRHYLAKRDPKSARSDHSNLHLVELLLDSRLEGAKASAIQQRFLETELRRTDFDGEAGSEDLCHYVEALGVMLASPELSWGEVQAVQVREWLARIPERQGDRIGSVPDHHLVHLARGLRQAAANWDRLSGAGG